MKKRETLRSWVYLILMAVVVMGMSILLSQVPARAAVNCSTVSSSSTTDTDQDGFTDYQECNGITITVGGLNTFFPGKKTNNPQTGLPYAITDRLDPDTMDLFVILVPAKPKSYFPANPLQFVSNPVAQGGLGLNPHTIYLPKPVTGPPVNRKVCKTSTQAALQVTESLDTSSPNLFGISSPGTPNGLDLATVYTQNIFNSLTSIIGGAPSQDLLDTYVKHTIAHETGHMIGRLAQPYNSNYGGYHYQSGSAYVDPNNVSHYVVMDQSVFYKGTTFYIGTYFSPADQSIIKLTGP